VLATAFFAHSTEIVAKMAGVLKRTEDAHTYRRLFDRIKDVFNQRFLAADGRITGDTQAGYALALNFNLLPEAMRPSAVRHALAGIQRYGGHLSTGIQTSHRLMLELTRYGQHAEAFRLANLRDFPSWGLMIDNGATTIWERWDGYVKGRGFQNPGMNSFNHWAFGAVGEWVWGHIAGINPDEAEPGFKHFSIRPQGGDQLTWARGRYDSIRGLVASDWRIENGRLRLTVSVPPNATATVYVPTREVAAVKEGDQPAAEAQGVRYLGQENGTAISIYEVESGQYSFSAPQP
jgi:alpha-L-rhamnosidase